MTHAEPVVEQLEIVWFSRCAESNCIPLYAEALSTSLRTMACYRILLHLVPLVGVPLGTHGRMHVRP